MGFIGSVISPDRSVKCKIYNIRRDIPLNPHIWSYGRNAPSDRNRPSSPIAAKADRRADRPRGECAGNPLRPPFDCRATFFRDVAGEFRDSASGPCSRGAGPTNAGHGRHVVASGASCAASACALGRTSPIRPPSTLFEPRVVSSPVLSDILLPFTLESPVSLRVRSGGGIYTVGRGGVKANPR